MGGGGGPPPRPGPGGRGWCSWLAGGALVGGAGCRVHEDHHHHGRGAAGGHDHHRPTSCYFEVLRSSY